MKKLLLGLLFLGGTANAATPPYGGTQISTTTGKATQYLPGVLSVSASSTTVSTPKIILDGAAGSMRGSSGTFTYGVSAATFTATGTIEGDEYTEGGSNTLTNDISGVAATATALAADPSDCSLPNVALGINTAGTAQCAQPSNVTGNAATATALAANGGNCSAGNFPLGVDASGAIESCTDAATQAELDTHAALTGTSAHSAASANTASAIVARDGSGNFAAGTITAAISGNATTATALAANGSNCSAGSYALGVDASGAAEGCTVAATGSGDAVLAATQTWTGINTFTSTMSITGYAPGLWVTIATASLVAQTTYTFQTGGQSGSYRIAWDMFQNTADGDYFIKMHDGGTSHDTRTHHFNFSDDTEQLGNITDAAFHLNHNNISPAVDTNGVAVGFAQFEVLNSDSSDAFFNGEAYYTQANNAARSVIGLRGSYIGTAAITQLSFYVSAGTFTGTLRLEKYHAK